jgi:hypothetical protein
MNPNVKRQLASYFGLTVEVICRMQHCAMIRYNERDFVVDTCDLVFLRQRRRAA